MGIVRLKNIEIRNFKNIEYGTVDFENNRKDFKASILGLYGQNGSGKTALIDALELLKYNLCGQKIPSRFCDFIKLNAERTSITVCFSISMEWGKAEVWYGFDLGRTEKVEDQNIEANIQESQYRPVILNESISVKFLEGEDTRKNLLIDTSVDVFAPKAKYEILVGTEKERTMDLLVTKKLMQKSSRSFAFSKVLLSAIRNNSKDEKYIKVLDALATFGNRELFIINTQNNGLISMNALPLAFKYRDEKAETIGNIMLPLDSPASIPEDAFSVIKKVIANMNIVLEAIVPGLRIDIVDLGVVLSKDGEKEKIVQFVSLKNKEAIPFKYESEGIKKIVSILQLLIVIYNNPSITVAVDELDAGVFEYLLGEMLKILSEKGKGQLIFTSHNLRPLETIDKGFVAFTTTNPQNRFIRMVNVKENNNLRDFYYRDIVLGEQKESLYDSTNNSEIALAFREAGESF